MNDIQALSKLPKSTLVAAIKATIQPKTKRQQRPKGPEIEVTIVKRRLSPANEWETYEVKEKINHLTILAYDDVYEYVNMANGNTRRINAGCHIASKNHFGWLVKESAVEVSRLIENVATKAYINPGKFAQER